jgi:hypothetical protein
MIAQICFWYLSIPRVAGLHPEVPMPIAHIFKVMDFIWLKEESCSQGMNGSIAELGKMNNSDK